MTPSIKLHSITFGLTTALVFSIWIKVFELIQINGVYKILLGGLISLGLYRLSATAIIYFVKTSNKAKKMFLGAYYLEGTWVGFYMGVSGNERFLIERFEQDIDTLVIRGKSYDETNKYHATWAASSVNIDILNGRISYMYECLPINDSSNNNGIAIFNFERNDQYSAPKGLTGFSSDLHIGKRVRAMEIKISDYCSVSEGEALRKAKELYEENKDKF
jgi:hypothetical protein